MERKINTLLFLFLLTFATSIQSVQAQNRLYLGVLAGGSADIFKIQPDNAFVSPYLRTTLTNFGACLSYRTNFHSTFFELNVSRHQHILNIESYPGNKLGGISSRDWTAIGLHARKSIPLVTNKLFISPRAGFKFGFVEGNGTGSETSYETGLGEFRYFYNIPIQPAMQSYWAEIGFNAELQFKNGMFLFGRFTYSQGLRKIFEDEIFIQFEQQDPVGYEFFSRGSAILFQFGLSYPISRIWEGKMPVE